jgi:hypothetical protein
MRRSAMRLEVREGTAWGQGQSHTWWGAAVRGAVIATILLLSWALGACGGGDNDNPSDEPGNGTPGTNADATATDVSGSVEELGDEVTQHYFDALDEMETLLGRELPTDSLRTEIQTLKDKYIETFVSYGHKREAMSDGDREVFDARVRQAITLSTPSALDVMSTATASLIADGETELADEIMSFNVITQYVFFDLLKVQEPEEAQRLGIP